MTQYIADEAHFKEVIARVPNVKRSLWIGTADIKDLYVGDRPFLGILADLISKGSAAHPCQGAGSQLPGGLRPIPRSFHWVGAGVMSSGAFQVDYP